MSKHLNYDKRVPIELDNVAITRDESKCILCGSCRSVCKFKQGVYSFYNLENTCDRAICIHCGQCSNVCPTKAITEVYDYIKVKELLNDPSKVVIFQTSPSVRVALGEEFGLEYGTFVEGKMVSALRNLGAKYVFDTTFGADLTIMEEATEFVNRVMNKEKLPLFTSCCPGWVSFVETFYPELIPNLSTSKSPILMQGSIIKTYVSKNLNIDPKSIINVAVTPCTAKKAEIKRSEMNNSGRYLNDESISDMDYVITTRELAKWLKEEKIDFNDLEESEYDSPLGKGSGAGVIFGNTGGVMEAAVRTAYHLITGAAPTNDLLEFTSVRGLEGIKETMIKINNIEIKIAVVSGTNNARKLIEKMRSENIHYDFIEVMACTGGCIAGGGQPKYDQTIADEVKEQRINSLYNNDNSITLRNSHENPDIIKIYNEFLNKPNSNLAKLLLHTTYQDRSEILNKSVNNEVKL